MRRTLPVPALAFPLILAGCSASEQEVVYVTETSWVNAEPSPIDDASPAPAKSDAPAAEPSDAPEPPTPAGFALDPAYKGKVGGSCGTTPDGATIRVGESTSCDFAAVVYSAAMNATWKMTNSTDAPSIPVTEIHATSPVTGKSYTLKCDVGSDAQGLWCHGSNHNPQVTFDRAGLGSGWHGLINIV